MLCYRVDRKTWDDPADCFRTAPVAWFIHEQDAHAYIIEFATDHLNPFFSFDIVKEWK